MSVRGAAAVAAKYMAAINVLAGWAILPFSSPPLPPSIPPSSPSLGDQDGSASPSLHTPAPVGCELIEVVRRSRRGRDGGGIYSGSAGSREGDRSIGPLPSERERRGNQPLITSALVFTLPCASILSLESLHSSPHPPTLNH